MTAKTPRRGRFDTDSQKIYVDNCATASITNSIEDCLTPPIPIRRSVKGIGGLFRTQVYTTTIAWDIEDDDGASHRLELPKSFYIPNAPSWLLSPQHWAFTAKDHFPLPRGTKCTTYDSAIELKWNQRKFKRTLPLDVRGSNVGELTTAPRYSKFHAFCTEVGQEDYANDDLGPIMANANVIDDDSDGDDGAIDTDDEHAEDYFPSADVPIQTDFPIDGRNASNLPRVEPDEEDTMPQTDSADLLRYHHRTGHVSMVKLQEMARQGMIPKRLATCSVPICTACAYGKATKTPWRTKGKQNRTQTVTSPGQCVSIDQLVSPTPGVYRPTTGKS